MFKLSLLLLLAASLPTSYSLTRSIACVDGEVFCSGGCEEVLLCSGDGSYISLANCTEQGKLCDPATTTCQNPEGMTCNVPPDEDMYHCHDTGRFPNPYDCYSYFDCPDPLPIVSKKVCSPAGHAYDPLSETCRLDSSSRVCREGPLPECTGLGQRGPVIENPNIYYYCYNEPGSAALVHWMFRCRDPAHIFENGHCQAPEAL